MKIIQIISSLGNGGAEKLIIELSNELEKNNEVILISFRKIENWMFFPKKIKDSVKVIELNKTKGFSPSLIINLFKIIRNENPNIIHIHLESTLRYLMLAIPFFKNIEFVYTIHNSFELFEKTFQRYSKIWFFKKIHFVCLSEDIEKEFLNSFSNLNFLTIHNGIEKLKASKNIQLVENELKKYRKNSQTQLFLFIGRLSYQKNIPLLLNVFSNISNENLKLLIIGNDTSEKQEILSLIKKQVGDNIIYLGAKENIQDYIQYSDSLILTSRHEGLPLVVLEAFSMGLPVISTPVGALPNIVVNGENGFLSENVSLKSILRSIDLFLNLSNEEKEIIKVNSINVFNQKYSIELCANKYNLLYKKELLKKEIL